MTGSRSRQDGDLSLRLGDGALALRAPVVYQQGQGGARERVDGRFELRGAVASASASAPTIRRDRW